MLEWNGDASQPCLDGISAAHRFGAVVDPSDLVGVSELYHVLSGLMPPCENTCTSQHLSPCLSVCLQACLLACSPRSLFPLPSDLTVSDFASQRLIGTALSIWVGCSRETFLDRKMMLLIASLIDLSTTPLGVLLPSPLTPQHQHLLPCLLSLVSSSLSPTCLCFSSLVVQVRHRQVLQGHRSHAVPRQGAFSLPPPPRAQTCAGPGQRRKHLQRPLPRDANRLAFCSSSTSSISCLPLFFPLLSNFLFLPLFSLTDKGCSCGQLRAGV